MNIEKVLKDRILVLDGAMGTTLIESAIKYSVDTILINCSTIDTTIISILYIKV